MGKPGGSHVPSPSLWGSQPGELKHLSSQRKRNQMRDSLSSGERKGISPNRVLYGPGVVGLMWGLSRMQRRVSRSGLERPARAGESPVGEAAFLCVTWVPE